MLKATMLALLGLIAVSAAANAQTCGTIPYTFSNGTTADATQVNGNFSTLLNCANTSDGIARTYAYRINNNTAGDHLIGEFSGSQSNRIRISLAGMNGYSGNISYAGETVISGQFNNNNALQGTWYNLGYANVSAVKFEPVASNDYRIYITHGSFYQAAVTVAISGGTFTPENTLTSPPSYSSPSEKFIVGADGGGSVGIATSSPTMTLYVNGTAGGTSAWSNSSDVRLKKNIAPIGDALAIVEQLQGVRFDWRSPEERSVGKSLALPTGEPQIGFIAQDVKKVLPEAVSVSHDSQALMSVSESKIVPVLVEAVKQLCAMNRTQAAEIQHLRRRVSALEHKSQKRTAER